MPSAYPEAVVFGEVGDELLAARYPVLALLAAITAHPLVSGLILLIVGAIVAILFGTD